nr:defensin-like protein 1 [Ipomoea batatas]
MAKSYTIFVAFLFCFLIATPTESKVGEEKVCGKLSQTYPGWCDGGECDLRCRTIEGAVSGSCHWHDLGMACFCYYNC